MSIMGDPFATNDRDEFQRRVQHLSGEIVVRFRRPVDGLNGARGLFAASKSVERAEFRAYVESRDLVQDFPGVRGFGFIQRVMRRDVDAFVAAERADEAPEFALRQLADKNHDDLYVIKFIEPAANNAGAQGLDIGSEANRRAAAQRAIDSGEPTSMSEKSGVSPGRNRGSGTCSSSAGRLAMDRVCSSGIAGPSTHYVNIYSISLL